MFLAYFSPEVTLPLASVLAAVFGFLMLIGRAPFILARKAFRALTGKSRTNEVAVDPPRKNP